MLSPICGPEGVISWANLTDIIQASTRLLTDCWPGPIYNDVKSHAFEEALLPSQAPTKPAASV